MALLDPVELSDAPPVRRGSWVVGTPWSEAALLHRLDAAVRHGRESWWAEVSPRYGCEPRCSSSPVS
ncbi:hypothetical protein ACK8HX_13565 [Oryzobacter sp. R7]|uniref:hypothetical protein n=1 Tax=Oryzobacter faecalis TaxID=3388656 RepID=UPI00398D65D7